MNRSTEHKPPQPWKSIADSVVPVKEAHLDYSDAMRSPCESCTTSPCCSYLPLAAFRVASLSDLDYALYLLNFERIELGLSSSGDWSVFYRYPCRYLDRSTFACTVHEQPEQPHICRRYNPYRCWYKAALTKSVTPDYIRLDRARLQYLITGIGFDNGGNIIESPDWQSLLPALDQVHDPPMNAQRDPVSGAEPPAIPQLLPIYTFGQVQHPCTGCSAYCCKALMFPMERPADISGLDYVRFCLGFPGIRVGISDTQWAILVDTRCRHLNQNRCSVFGQPERPLTCRYYDEWRCSYKRQFEEAESVGVLHVGLDQYRRVLDRIEFDQSGAVQRIPPVAELRNLVNEVSADAPTRVALQRATANLAQAARFVGSEAL